jgi:hypothetical protein
MRKAERVAAASFYPYGNSLANLKRKKMQSERVEMMEWTRVDFRKGNRHEGYGIHFDEVTKR